MAEKHTEQLKAALKTMQDATAEISIHQKQLTELRAKRTAIEEQAKREYGVEAKNLSAEAGKLQAKWEESVLAYAQNVINRGV